MSDPEAWPTVRADQATRLAQLIDSFAQIATVNESQPIVRALLDLTSAHPWDDERMIWAWFGEWCRRACEFGEPTVAIKVALFTLEWHEAFVPQSGTAWISLGTATPEQRTAIDRGAFDACIALDPSIVVYSGGAGAFTVGAVHQQLAANLGRAIDGAGPASRPPEKRSVVSSDEPIERPFDTDAAIADMREVVDQAIAGDAASTERARGIYAAVRDGDDQAALSHFEAAAQLGDPGAMFDASSMARRLGLDPQARFWLEAAAAAGHGGAMYDLGVEAHEQGDLPLAQMWLERAAQAGTADAYGALTQLASDRDDAEDEFRWSGLGAQAGQSFCQLRHGHMLMQANPADPTVITEQAIPLLMQALNAGEAGALFYIGVGYAQIGDNANARVWLTRAEETGDPDATRVLDKYGLR